MKRKGSIALDIDGTITLDKYSVPDPVISYLRKLALDGWQIVVATGRPASFALRALSKFDFPYLFLAQNGSIALEMPEKKILFKKYLTSAVVPHVDTLYEGLGSDFLVYAGFEKGDFCYFRPKRLSLKDLAYVKELQKMQKEGWQEVETFEVEPFPLIKCFGPKAHMEAMRPSLEASGLFQIAVIQDPFEAETSLLLLTEKSASKGLSLESVFEKRGRGDLVIAAGDDENDLSMLKKADVKIVMPHAPDSLKGVASIIAKPTKECGIIQALEEAISFGT